MHCLVNNNFGKFTYQVTAIHVSVSGTNHKNKNNKKGKMNPNKTKKNR